MATKLGVVVADFTTSLATAIAVSGTSASLQSATDDDGNALPAGRYFFSLDGSNSSKEHISADLSGASLTNIKSVSRQGVESSGVARAHRVGCAVALTDFAHLKYINDLVAGTTTLNASVPLGYDGAASITTNNQLATKLYVDGVAIAGAPDAAVSTKGITKISVAPVSPTAPIAVGDNDTRLPQNSYAADSGSSNAFVITLSPAPAAYVAGQEFAFKASFTNTGSATLNVNSLGAKTLKKLGATNLVSGDIASGQIVVVRYDGTNLQVISKLTGPTAVTARVYANGTTTHDMSSTATQTIAHGLSVTPTRVTIRGVYGNIHNSVDFHGNSIGVLANGTMSMTGLYVNQTTAASTSSEANSSYIIKALVGTGPDYCTATCAVDGTNITLTWSKNNTPTGTLNIAWEVEGETTTTT